VVAEYNGLEVNGALQGISNEIEKQTREFLNKTPFEVMSVVMGNSAPPAQVIQAISTKVALNQTLEQKAIEEQIAEKNIAIERKNGEAAGAFAAAQAQEQSKAISTISQVLSPVYIEFLQAENIKGAQRIYVPFGGQQFLLPLADKDQPREPASKPSGPPRPPEPGSR
jgi:hypothetical protein